MRRRVTWRTLLATAAAVTLMTAGGAAGSVTGAPPADRALMGDATVIAVIDTGFSPYHQDFSASRIKGGRLPLGEAPHTWLPGFPDPAGFASYSPLRLTLAAGDDADIDGLHARDQAQWDSVAESGTEGVQYRWIPGTKVVGALTFGPQPEDRASSRALFSGRGDIYGSGSRDHGMGTASAAVGNTFGTCPQCLLVFIQYTTQDSAERALTWANRQPWIDAVTNSYGFSNSVGVRDQVYNGTDVETMRDASERGQTTFFSAGNGVENNFTVPQSTLLSSQKGPDWVVTVSATDPDASRGYSGTGKPADVVGIGSGYPTSYNATTASNGEDFAGTSNAAPQIAGTYGRALWEARRALRGTSRTQRAGVVAAGDPVTCGSRRRNCELSDGRLTAVELRARLLRGATPTAGAFTDGLGGGTTAPAPADARFANEGHGTYRGRLDPAWESVFASRVMAPMLGRTAEPRRPVGETEWFRVDSACRQHIWGKWAGGAYTDDRTTPQPTTDPTTSPTRALIQTTCPYLSRPAKPIL